MQSLLDCGFFPQALEELQAFLHPGVLPPAPLVLAILQHALDVSSQHNTMQCNTARYTVILITLT